MGEPPVLLLHNLDPDWSSEDRDTAVREAVGLATSMREIGHRVETVALDHADLAARLTGYHPDEWIVFNWCEELPGIPHSDARVAEILESLGFTFTGAAPDVLRSSWDKAAIKRLLDERGLPTPRWRICESPAPEDWSIYPAIVKPAREHCSFGVTTDAVVRNFGELQGRIAHVLETYRQPALVEDFIDGREFHVSLWGNGDVQMLPVAEMDFSRFDQVRDRLCTYDSKFRPGSRHYEDIGLLLPAPLSDVEYDRLYRTARSAYDACRCRDLARLDIRLRDGIFHILDINPNPDMSSDASMACAAEAAGLSFGAMGSRLIRLAAERHPRFGHRGGSGF